MTDDTMMTPEQRADGWLRAVAAIGGVNPTTDVDVCTGCAEDLTAERDAALAEVGRLRDAQRMRDPKKEPPPVGVRVLVMSGRTLFIAGCWNPEKYPPWTLDRYDGSPTIRGWWPLPPQQEPP